MLLLSEPFFISTVGNALKFICFSGGLGFAYLYNFHEWMWIGRVPRMPLTTKIYFIYEVFICPIAIAYSMGQIIKSVCVYVCVCVSVCEHFFFVSLLFLDIFRDSSPGGFLVAKMIFKRWRVSEWPQTIPYFRNWEYKVYEPVMSLVCCVYENIKKPER